ncbi:MAG: DMT family transporter [Anaerolineales bacterium]|nr:MAG: DMT family transporter [Anaerolineales bacterium]
MNSVLVDESRGERYKAIGFLIVTAVLWSSGGLLIKWISWNPLAIAGTRSAIAALVLLVVLRRPHLTWSSAQIGGAIAYAVTVILFVLANKLTTAANAILLQYTSPIYIALFGAWFLGERATRLDWITIFVVIGGMVLFFLDDLTTGGFWGNVCAISSGVTFACLVLFMRKQKDGSPLESIFLGNILTALVGLPFMFEAMPSASSWVGLLLSGVLQLGLSHVLYAAAIKHIAALEAILIAVIEPILNPLWVLLIMGETPGPWALLGGFIVLVSVTIRYVATAF